MFGMDISKWLYIRILFFVLFRVILCTVDEESYQPRIIGGWLAIIQHHPYHVYIEGQNLCGGAIIGKSWILTAANCEVGTTTVFAGSNLRGKGTPHNVKSVMTMPLYENREYYHEFDLMLLELDRPLFLSPTIQPIKMGRESDIVAGRKGFVTGFGVTAYNGEMSNYLHKLELTIKETNECKRHWHKNFHEPSQLCAGTTGERNVWNGDIGGPFVVDHNLLGIVSYGHKGRDELVMFTSVPTVRLWIFRVTGIY